MTMTARMRHTGLDVLGDRPWGTHMCQFYQTSQELREVLVNYFRRGLADRELCVWVTPDPRGVSEAREVLRQAVPDADERIRVGQMELLEWREWCPPGAAFDAARVLQGWLEKERAALQRGYEGLRISGDALPGQSDRKAFADHERNVEAAIGSHRILALCTYPVDQCTAPEVLDVLRHHSLALFRQDGRWEVLEGPRKAQGGPSPGEVERRQKAILDAAPDPAWLKDKQGRFLAVNAAWCRFFGRKAEDVLERTMFDFLPADIAERLQGQDDAVVHSFHPLHTEEMLLGAEGKPVWFETIKTPLLSEHGEVQEVAGLARDITQRKRAEVVLKAERDLTCRLAAARHMDDIASVCLDAALQVSGVECGGIYTRDPGSGSLRLSFHRGLSRQFVESVTCIDRNSVQESILDGGNAVQIPRARMKEMGMQAALREGLSAIVAIPVLFEQRPVACLNIASRTAPAISADVQLALEAVAAQMGAAIARAQAEESLQESESVLRSFFDSPGFMRGLVEVTGGDILHISDNAVTAAFFGRPQHAMRNRYASEMGVPPDVQQMWIDRYEESRRSKRPVQFEYRHTAASGTSWLLATVTFLGTAASGNSRYAYVVSDITHLKRTEESLRQSQERLKDIINTPLVAVGIGDAAGRITEVNDAFVHLLGYSREELLSGAVTWLDLTPPEYAELDRRCVAELEATGKFGPYEKENLCKDGTRVPILVGAARLPGPANEHAAFLLDIRERRHAEQQRLEMERRLQATQKLESLGVLAGGIAHEFNNILTAIIGYADLARLRLPSPHPLHSNLDAIIQAGHRAAELTRQMLAYSGKGRVTVESLNLSRMVEDMRSILDVSTSKKSVLKYDLAADLPAIDADPSQINQVILNLVLNAAEAVGEASGTITVSTDTLHWKGDDDAQAGELPPGTYVRLAVCDTGCGMDQEIRERIFEPFFTTKFPGRGLGLAAVHGIVQSHHGAIRVASKPGKGSTFQVLFPASSRGADPGADAPAEEQAGARGMVLVVDDEASVRDTAEQALHLAGFSTLAAGDGEESLELFRRHRERIVCVLLDLTMPRLNGAETLRGLRQLCTRVPVVLSSGHSEENVVAKFSGLGVAGFLSKPYQVDALHAAINEAVAGRAGQHAHS